MIDTALWKHAIERNASQLGGYYGKKNLSHVSAARLERLLMESFYLLHKLMDDHRIDDRLAETEIPIRTVRSEGMRHYLSEPEQATKRLSESTTATMRLGVITNKIIHSYLILPSYTAQQGLQKVVICSEFEHFDRLIIASLDDLLSPLNLNRGGLRGLERNNCPKLKLLC